MWSENYEPVCTGCAAFNFFPFQFFLQTDQRKFKQRNTNIDQKNWPIYYILVQGFRVYCFFYWSFNTEDSSAFIDVIWWIGVSTNCSFHIIFILVPNVLNWRINNVLLPHNIYYGAKLHKAFSLSFCYWHHFQSDQTNTIIYTFNCFGLLKVPKRYMPRNTSQLWSIQKYIKIVRRNFLSRRGVHFTCRKKIHPHFTLVPFNFVYKQQIAQGGNILKK